MGKGAKIILIIIAILLVCCGAFAIYVLKQPDVPVEQSVESAPEAEATAEPGTETTPEPMAEPEDMLPDGRYNVLFVGTDSRSDTEPDAIGLSDSMMVVSYDTNTNVVTLISFMRDSMVWRTGVNTPWLGKLNAAYKSGGVEELVNTLNYNFELGIQDYITVGYEGFSTLVEELGGVDLAITSDEAYYINWRSADIPQDYFTDQARRVEILQELGRPVLEEDYEGTKVQHLGGYQALWYARNRTTESADGIAGSDGVRINRQQVLMELIYEKVRTEMNLDTAIALIKFAFQYVATDIDIVTMTKLGTKLLRADDISFVNVRVPFEGTSRTGNGAIGENNTGLYFDIEETEARLHEIVYGTGE